MKTKLIPAALIAAMIVTPAMACPDWKAVAPFDAILVASDQNAENESCSGGKYESSSGCMRAGLSFEKHMSDVVEDRKSAIADKCQENAR
jgi:hypothetical protein